MELSPYQRLFAEAERNAIPLDVLIELTHRCNHRCRHCYITDFDAPDLLPADTILRLLDELAAMGTLRLALSGGEVLLRCDWLEIAERARRLGFELRLLTNGSLVTEAIADALARLSAGVEISLHSSGAEAFDSFTRTPGSFEKTTRGIRLLRERGVEVLLKVPITIHNYRQLDAIGELAASLGADCLMYPGITPANDGSRVPIVHRAPERLLLSYYAGHTSHYPVAERSSGGTLTEGPLCAAASRLACVSPSGDVLPCVGFPIVAGNIRERSFRDIWENSPLMRRIRAIRRADLKPCNTCDRFAYCERCHALALAEDGDLLGVSSWACEHADALEEAARRRGA